MSKTLCVDMLGGLRVRAGDSEVTRFRTQKTAALLGYLALHASRSHSREELVDLFWPDSDIEAGRTSLRASLSSLRQQLEPPGISPSSVLIADRTYVRLNPEAIETDVSKFESGWASAGRIPSPEERAGALSRVAEMYRGPFLSGHYDDWALLERDRLQQTYIAVLRSAASSLSEVGDLTRAIQALQKLLSIEPLAEEVHADLIRLYAASGNLASALRQYKELERVLRDELDTTPSADARELYEQLSRGTIPDDLKDLARQSRRRPIPPQHPTSGDVASNSVAPSTPPSSQSETHTPELPPLPRMLTRFFGREEEISSILTILRTPGGRLLTLTGPGGSGKTRLAIEGTGRLAAEFRNQVVFVPLSEVTDSSRIPDSITSALGLPKDTQIEPLEQIVEVVRGRPFLMVLDSFEQVAEDGPSVILELLERAPLLSCLVTSRQRLEIGGELELAVAPLPVPAMAGSPDYLERYPSVQLFTDRAQAARSGFALTAENAAAVAAVCERLEGIPLAIELAAAWADILTPAQILARLTHRFDLLSSRRKDLAPRHRTLRATFDWTYRLLNPDVQRFFSMLSVFRGGWTLEAAEVICEEPLALDFLQQLRERSLLVTVEAGDEMRYRFLDTVREYAESQYSEIARVDLQRRHLDYFESFAEAAKDFYHGPQQTAWLSRLEVEHDNIRAALDWALENSDSLETALRLAGHLEYFWGVRGYVREGLDRYRGLLERATKADFPVSVRANVHHGAGVLAFAVGDFIGCTSHMESAIQLYRQDGDRKGEADALTFQGLATDQSDHQRAKAILLEARTAYEAVGDEGGLAHALKCLATNAQNLGDPVSARELIEQGLALYRKRDDKRGIAMMLGQLATLALAQGEYARAEETLKEHLALSRELNDMGHMAVALENLGKAVKGRGDFYIARTYFEQCLAIYRELGHRWGTVTAIHNLGVVAMEQGNYREAREQFEQSLEIAREIDERRSVASILGDMGTLAHRSGDYAVSHALLHESAAAYRVLGDRWGEIKSLRDMGLLAMDEGDLDRAEELQSRSRELAQEVGDRHSVGMAFYNLGDIARHRGDIERARSYWEQCLTIDRELGIKGGSVLGALATIAERAREFARARKLWEASLREHWSIGDRLGTSECISGLADVALAEGSFEKSARLHGAADHLRSLVGAPLSSHRAAAQARRADRLQDALGKESAEALIDEGRNLSLEKAVVFALNRADKLPAAKKPESARVP